MVKYGIVHAARRLVGATGFMKDELGVRPDSHSPRDAVVDVEVDAAEAAARRAALGASLAGLTAGQLLGRFEQLTRRERQVLWLVVRGGLSNRQMAVKMGAAEKTIKVHRGRLTQKMQVVSVADLVRMVDLLPLEARADAGPKRRSRRRSALAWGGATHGVTDAKVEDPLV